VLKGGVTAWASVIAAVVLGGGAAGLSLATSPITHDYVSASTRSPAEVLEEAVAATLNTPSFIEAVTTSPQTSGAKFTTVFVYDGPDLCKEQLTTYGGPGYFSSETSSIIVGKTTYTLGPGNTWSKAPTGAEQPCKAATVWLTALSRATRVRASGDKYVSVTPVSYSSSAVHISVSTVTTSIIKDGRVVSEEMVTTARNTAPTPTSGGPTGGTTVFEVGGQVSVTYSAFGNSPPITAPPASDISS
jgi:hypothetical protein